MIITEYQKKLEIWFKEQPICNTDDAELLHWDKVWQEYNNYWHIYCYHIYGALVFPGFIFKPNKEASEDYEFMFHYN